MGRGTRGHRSCSCKRRQGERGGAGPVGVVLGLPKLSYKITKRLSANQEKNAKKIHAKRLREVQTGKRKKYAGESWNCPIM